MISSRVPVSVGSLWVLRDEVQAEAGPEYNVGVQSRTEKRPDRFSQPFVDIVVEEIVGGRTVGALVRSLKAAAERWRASGAAPSSRVARARVWVYDRYGQLHLQWEEEAEDRE